MGRDVKEIRWNVKLHSSGFKRGTRGGPAVVNTMMNLRFTWNVYSVVNLYTSNTQFQVHISAGVSSRLLTPHQRQHRISHHCPPAQNPFHTLRALSSPQFKDRFYNPPFLKSHTVWKFDKLRFKNFISLKSHKILNKLNNIKHNKVIEIYMVVPAGLSPRSFKSVRVSSTLFSWSFLILGSRTR